MSKKNLATVLFKNSDLLKFHTVKFNNFASVLYEQSGGGKKLTVDYNGTKYEFNENSIDPDHWFLTSSEGDDCVFVIIDRTSGVGEIHGIGNYKSCLVDTNQSVGSTLLKITLKMLHKYKEKLGIKLILLTDNSVKKCKNKEIKLALMLTLLSGDTWYGKYGFRPVIRSAYSYTIDKTNLDYYEKNKQIMNQVKINDIDLIKYISLTKNDKLIKAVVRLVKTNPNMLVKDFLTNFIRDYDSTCEIFYEFYEKLFVGLGLFGFYRYLFGLYL
jgi:hypothetical protein